MKTKKLVTLSVTVALAMVLSFLESRIPQFIPVPGVKIGFANLAVLFALYRFGVREAALVSFVRVLLISVLFGTPVVWIYSTVGAALSLLAMALCKKFSPFSAVGVSVAGGVFHNVGQIATAALLMASGAVFSYLPILLIAGTVAGVLTGVICTVLLKRIPE